MSRTITIVIGTKAELIKTFPIMLELQKQGRDYWFIHTGQHNLGKFCEDFGVKRPDFVLSEEPNISTKFWSKINNNSLKWFFGMVFKIQKVLKKIKPNYVVYHGDTMSSAAAAIASSKILNSLKKWRSVHLEAGLRSGSLIDPFPEEISRIICDRFSDICLAVSSFSENNLRKSHPLYKIRKVGNTVVDSSLITYDETKKIYKKTKAKYALINIHRHENLNNKKRLSKIVEIVNSAGINSVWPLHDNTKMYLEKYGLMEKIKANKKIEITPLENYFKFISLIANCEYIITDGGSIQEESLVFNKPCVILRKRTERKEGLETGINFLTQLDVEKSKRIIKYIESGEANLRKFKNPYGERGLSKKIVEILR